MSYFRYDWLKLTKWWTRLLIKERSQNKNKRIKREHEKIEVDLRRLPTSRKERIKLIEKVNGKMVKENKQEIAKLWRHYNCNKCSVSLGSCCARVRAIAHKWTKYTLLCVWFPSFTLSFSHSRSKSKLFELCAAHVRTPPKRTQRQSETENERVVCTRVFVFEEMWFACSQPHDGWEMAILQF